MPANGGRMHLLLTSRKRGERRGKRVRALGGALSELSCTAVGVRSGMGMQCSRDAMGGDGRCEGAEGASGELSV
jgi:hypothetical protein